MGQRGISCLAVHGLPRHITIPRCLLSAVYLHGPRPKRRQRRTLLGRLLLRHPRDPLPRLFQPDPGGRTSQPQVPPHCHILPLPELLLLRLPKPPGHRQVPQRRHLQDPVTAHPKAVPGLPLCVPGPAPDVHLFSIEMAREGKAWGQVGPHRGPIGGVLSENPPPCLHHAPLQLRPTTTRAPPAAAPPLRSAPPGGTPHDFRGSHGWLSHHGLHAR